MRSLRRASRCAASRAGWPPDVEDLAYVQTHALEESHWWFVGMRETYRKQIEGLRPGQDWKILDVGCGTGGNLSLLEQFGRTWAVDYSPAAAAFTRGRGWPLVSVASATELPFPDQMFDLVTAFGVIEHVERDDYMLREMLRVTRSGGHLLFMTSAHPWLWSVHDDHVHHLRRYRRKELSGLVSDAGWRLEQLSYANSTLFPPIALVRAIQRLLPKRDPREEQGMSGFGLPPAPLNRALAALLSFEGSLMKRMNLPMGVGFICRARRDHAGTVRAAHWSGAGARHLMLRGSRSIVRQFEDPSRSLKAYLYARWLVCPFDRVLPLVPERGRLLDVGCGSGLWLTYLALERPGLQLEGVDPDPSKLALAATSKAGQLTLHEGSADELPEGTYDCITILDVLYLMSDADKSAVLAGCFRTLKPGGTLVVKELDTKPRWKFAPSALEEFVAVRVVGMTHGERLHFQSVEELTRTVTQVGFRDAEMLRIDRGYIHPHVVVRAHKPIGDG